MRAAVARSKAGGLPGGLGMPRIKPDASFKERAYSALKDAILSMDPYSSPEPIVLEERALSGLLGVSRTPVREALAVLHQEGFVKITPRRGIVVVRRTKAEIVQMIEAWAALESMAARLCTQRASDEDIAALRPLFARFGPDYAPATHIGEYSSVNIAFHQGLVRLSGSEVLVSLTDKLIIHVRAIRHRMIFEGERAEHSLNEHLAIIEALEARDGERAERASRDHTLRLAAYVDEHFGAA